ncbi:hypothetical protein CkaCkLH20_10462 [Colletotrichum karsti]|uniref:2EXR domain-containing protein n=1 Tax=Colletotrichum karsti TaxID=1095194 RepID=A0A9P6I524_9PEZI|nr:uncharacterized protein CkaCkLH20_10462 [Colletotrichum karsti]KAF9872125.1 hypothetical protein CkaCkLH20_10462 [Colletotrichum karsti]
MPTKSPPRPNVCKHLQRGWYDRKIGVPETVRDPQEVLKELINNAVIGGNHAADREFITDILKNAEDNRKTASNAPTLSFPKFRQLPAEIRKEIWLFSVPERIIHITGNTPGRICWNRRLPIPAPALACHEAWSLIRPLMHEMLDDGGLDRFRRGEWSVKRVAWITPSDSLSLGDNEFQAWCWFPSYRSQLPVFKRITISLEQIEAAVSISRPQFCGPAPDFQFHTMKQIHIVIQTVTVSIGERMGLDKMAPIDKKKPFSTPVKCITVNQRTVKRLKETWERDYEREPEYRTADTHFVEMVDLQDRSRLNEVINLSSVMGGFGWTPRRRLETTYKWDRAFCFDCLPQWWEHRGLPRAKRVVSTLRNYEIMDAQHDRRSNGHLSWEETTKPELPELVPTVRILIRFPGRTPPGITTQEVEDRLGPRHQRFLRADSGQMMILQAASQRPRAMQ